MKKLLGILILSLLLKGNANAFNFKEDIETYSLKNEGVVSSIYILNRCSGLFTFVAAMVINEPGNKDLAEKYIDYSVTTIHAATIFHSNHHSVDYEKAREILMKRRTELINHYKDDAEKLFLRNGSYISDYILEDVKQCIAASEFFKNR
jgi:spermidine/putrescine-binding protein